MQCVNEPKKEVLSAETKKTKYGQGLKFECKSSEFVTLIVGDLTSHINELLHYLLNIGNC